MRSTWEILKKELAVFDFRISDKDTVEFHTQQGVKSLSYDNVIDMLCQETTDNISVLESLWENLAKVLSEQQNAQNPIHDTKISSLFIFALKDLAKFIDCFDNPSLESFRRMIKWALDKDILYFSSKQINSIIDLKITIDWVHRVIQKTIYIRKLIRFAKLGQFDVNNKKIIIAEGVSGPFANLDLPWGERIWKWDEEDENFRGRDSDLRKQRRYRKGLENYNTDEVGEGHYWRELRNEPFAWEDRSTDSPYPGRNVLFWN